MPISPAPPVRREPLAVVDPGHHYVYGQLLHDRFLAVLAWFASDPEAPNPAMHPKEPDPFLLLVDTATERAVVRRQALEKLGLQPFLQAIGPHVRLWDLPPGTALYRIDAGLLGDYAFRGWTVLAVDSLTDYLPTDLDVDGIVGMEWLGQHFERICLILDEEMPRLELHTPGPASFHPWG
jgi:hypothetical protein